MYIDTDNHGVMRVAGSRVMLDSVVAGFEQGLSPEAIQQQYPSLSLEQVYGAITYYLGHREPVQQYLRQQDQIWATERSSSQRYEGAVVARLRALQKTHSHSTS